jgi:glucose/arabinose dehydrogenase
MSVRRSRIWGLAALAIVAAAIPATGSAAARGSGSGAARLKPIGNFDQPVFVTGARAFPRLLFVVERPGVIRVIRRGRTLERPFLDITSLVESASHQERGLLSVAFPPDYRKSRRFYVYYTDHDGNIRIDEFRRSSRDPTHAVRSSRRGVITIPHPSFPNHDGGQLQFHGNELFIGTGDGGLGGDPSNNAQNTDVLLGKLLRIDPRRTKAGRPYGVPRSNPYVGGAGRDEIFSYGLRNPYRFSIQDLKGKPDRVAIGDVGQSRFEEVDYLPLPDARGANFGWDAWEGFELYDATLPPSSPCGPIKCPLSGTPDPGGTIKPIYAYDHDRGCAVTGGYVVRDPALPSLRGRYLYGDYCEGDLHSFLPRIEGARGDRSTGLHVDSLSCFGEAPDGRLFACSLDGPVYRVAPR